MAEPQTISVQVNKKLKLKLKAERLREMRLSRAVCVPMLVVDSYTSVGVTLQVLYFVFTNDANHVNSNN